MARPPRAGLRLGVAASILLAALPSAASVRLRPTGSQIDLVLIGLAVFQTNLTQDLEGFFDSSDQLPAEFTNRQILNLRMEGQLREGVALEAEVHHDRENLRDWRYRIRLAGERNSIAAGELEGAFRDTSLTRYDTPYYGAEAAVAVGKLTTRAFATLREGNYRIDRLRGANLSGPYILTASPILEGSERVAVEIRDRRDEEKLIRSDAKERGVDYVIDYFTGTLQFDAPIEAETFDGDPIQVVVEYQFEARGGSSAELLGGARLVYEPVTGVKLGTTYMRATGASDSALAGPGILGIDQEVVVGDWLKLKSEMAGPGGHFLDRRDGAWQMEGRVVPLAGLEVKGRYHRVGGEFETLANPRLDADLDREEWELDTSFLPHPAHRLSAGYGVKTDNVARDPDLDRNRTRIVYFGWEGRIHAWPLLRARYERRLTDGWGQEDGARLAERASTSLTFDLEDEVGRLPLFGATTIKAQYRLDLNDAAADADAADDRVHALRFRVDGRPREGLESFIELRQQWTRPGASDGVGSDSTELLFGGRQRVRKSLSAGASLRLRGMHDAEGATSDTATAILDFRWEPSPRFRSMVKYELTLASSGDGAGAVSGEAESRNLFGQVAVIPITGLTATFGYKLDERTADQEESELASAGEYFASLLYRRGESLTLFARVERGLSEERLPPFDPTRSERRTRLVGASFDVTPRWRVLGELREELLEGAVEAERRVLVLELSRSLGKLFRLGLGTELTLDQQGADARIDRRRIYLKLIGRL